MILDALPYFVWKLIRYANFGDGGGDGGGDGSGGDGTGGDGTGGFGGDAGVGVGGGADIGGGVGSADTTGSSGAGPTGDTSTAPEGGPAGDANATGFGTGLSADLGFNDIGAPDPGAAPGPPGGLATGLAADLGFNDIGAAQAPSPGSLGFVAGAAPPADFNATFTAAGMPAAPAAAPDAPATTPGPVTAQDLANLTGWMTVDQAGAFISPSGVVDWGAFNQAVNDFEQANTPNSAFFGPGGFNPNDPAAPPGSLSIDNISIEGQPPAPGLGVSGDAGGGTILMPAGDNFSSLDFSAGAPDSLALPGLPGLEGGVELADGTVVPEPTGDLFNQLGGVGAIAANPPNLTPDQIRQILQQLFPNGLPGVLPGSVGVPISNFGTVPPGSE